MSDGLAPAGGTSGPPAKPESPPAAPAGGAGPVTLEDVKRVVSEALAGLRPGRKGGDDGDSDVARQLREELATIRTHDAEGRKADRSRIAELEKQLLEATKAGGAGGSGGTPAGGGVGDLKPVGEKPPVKQMRRITRFMWGGNEDE